MYVLAFLVKIGFTVFAEKVGMVGHFTSSLRKHALASIQQHFTAVKMLIFRSDFLICFFFIFAQNIDCGYTLEPPHEYPQSMF